MKRLTSSLLTAFILLNCLSSLNELEIKDNVLNSVLSAETAVLGCFSAVCLPLVLIQKIMKEQKEQGAACAKPSNSGRKEKNTATGASKYCFIMPELLQIEILQRTDFRMNSIDNSWLYCSFSGLDPGGRTPPLTARSSPFQCIFQLFILCYIIALSKGNLPEGIIIINRAIY
jgi:hypothetical protein